MTNTTTTDQNTLTVEKIQAYAEAKGIDYEIDLPQSFVRYNWDREVINASNSITRETTMIGIEFTRDCYFWFVTYYGQNDSEVCFVERYNRNNGKSITAFTTGWNAERKILAFLNVQAEKAQARREAVEAKSRFADFAECGE